MSGTKTYQRCLLERTADGERETCRRYLPSTIARAGNPVGLRQSDRTVQHGWVVIELLGEPTAHLPKT